MVSILETRINDDDALLHHAGDDDLRIDDGTLVPQLLQACQS